MIVVEHVKWKILKTCNTLKKKGHHVRFKNRIMIFHPIIELNIRFPLKAAIIAKLSPCSRRLIQ